MTVQQAFDLARQHHQAGRLAEAEALYRQILAVQPLHSGALQLLGFLAHQTGRNDLAIESLQQAIALEPGNGGAWSTLANAYRAIHRHEEALVAYRHAAQLDPRQAEVHFNLGVAFSSLGQQGDAAVAFRRALELKPDFVEAHNNLGSALQDLGQFEQAVAAYCHALGLRPEYAEAHNNLGLALARLHRLGEALASHRRALELQPRLAPAEYNLGNVLRDQGQFDEAIAAYRRALALQPSLAAVCNNLGALLKERGQFEEAITILRRAIELQPAFAEAHNNLGNAFSERGQIQEAMAAYGRALVLQPAFAEAHNNAGNALKLHGQFDEAITAYHRAIELQPDFAEAWNNLGSALRQRGNLDAALAAFRQALAFTPERALFHSNLILALHFDPRADASTIAAEQRRWNERFGVPAKRFIQPHGNDRRPDRRLKIGYVSPDFYDHVVGRNILPLLQNHDRRDLEILCYSAVVQPDKLTVRFREGADHWRNTLGVGDEALAEMIRQDGVDILVDLAQHSAGNRLPLFARRPAPVQVSFAGYPESTGVEAIQYRISDRWLECGASRRDAWIVAGGNTPGSDTQPCDSTPAGVPEGSAAPAGAEPVMVNKPGVLPPAMVLQPSGLHRAERLFLLDSFWCYDPCGAEIEVNALPVAESGHVTFGCLNSFSKVNAPLVELWSRVLKQLPNARLVILAAAGSHRERTAQFLDAQGVATRQVEFVDPRPRRGYLELYRRLDIVLDTFPYNGHTTSLDALWMGVPVVSLAGERPVSRAGLSQLSNLGLPELVAHTEDEYVEIATRLAGDLPHLAELRRTLRPRMEASVLMDSARFARNIETAYRTMWQQWCAENAET